MLKIITEHQSAFTKSRLISNNILVTFKSLHSMQRHIGKDDYMAIKLDMSKAYDRVEWTYLKVVIRKMRFTEQWIKLTMLCVSSISYSILVNGEPKGRIIPSRGIRQGDPLSLSFSSYAQKACMVPSAKQLIRVIFEAIPYPEIALV